MPNDDIIKINTDIKLTDSNGNPISVISQPPEFLVETFAKNDIVHNEKSTGDE